jgi:hypothetical protein
VNIEEVLDATYPSILLIEERESNQIVVGAPHHAPAGIRRLPCKDHEPSDENTGYLARYLAEELQCSSIIACNYTIDANKCLKTDYAMQIAKWAPKLLVEIHAHSGTATPIPKDVEISCGAASKNELSMKLATQLAEALNKLPKLSGISVNGSFDAVPKRLRASQTPTINDPRWLGYHLEISPKLRIPRTLTGKPPAIGYSFCESLAQVLADLARSDF